MEKIQVKLLPPTSRKFWYMYYQCPISGKREKRSTGETHERKAWKKAAAWEAELNAGTYRKPTKQNWEQFVETYNDEILVHKSASTAGQANAVFNHLSEMFAPKSVGVVATPRLISEFQNRLRQQGKPNTTIASYLRHLRPALNWAKRQGFIKQVPVFEMPEVTEEMRGRAITGEEFDRVIDSVPKVRKTGDEKIWQNFLRGLWWSGLRLNEALRLSWEPDAEISVCLHGKHPAIRYHVQKNKKVQVVPMAVEFWEMIQGTPDDQRFGPVLPLPNGRGDQLSVKRAGRTISDIGEQAKVLTKRHESDPDKNEYASAHDFRRSFGTRWAKRVKPLVLQKMMRHTKLDTTLKYYADLDNDWIGDEIWYHSGTTSDEPETKNA